MINKPLIHKINHQPRYKNLPMPLHNELFLRVVTGLIGVPLVVILICLGSPYLDGLAYLLLAGMLIEWLNLNKKTAFRSLKGMSLFLSGGLYIVTAIVFLLSWRHQPWLIVWLLSIVWATDIGAYFIGSYFGGPKLAPRISPRKTWSGFVGGILVGMVAGWSISTYTVINSPLSLPITVLLLSIAAQLGDLLESRIKRYFGVKDSGNIIPGHGGLLDRLDSLLFVAICYQMLLILMKF